MSSSSESVRRLTVGDIAKQYADGQRIAMLTAYDYPTAKILDEAGIPLLLVGDSLGQVLLGYESTVRVTILDAEGGRAELPLMSKRAVADEILDRVARALDDRDAAAQTA